MSDYRENRFYEPIRQVMAKCLRDGNKRPDSIQIIYDKAKTDCPIVMYKSYGDKFTFNGRTADEVMSRHLPPYKKCPEGCRACSIKCDTEPVSFEESSQVLLRVSPRIRYEEGHFEHTFAGCVISTGTPIYRPFHAGNREFKSLCGIFPHNYDFKSELASSKRNGYGHVCIHLKDDTGSVYSGCKKLKKDMFFTLDDLDKILKVLPPFKTCPADCGFCYVVISARMGKIPPKERSTKRKSDDSIKITVTQSTVDPEFARVFLQPPEATRKKKKGLIRFIIRLIFGK